MLPARLPSDKGFAGLCPPSRGAGAWLARRNSGVWGGLQRLCKRIFLVPHALGASQTLLHVSPAGRAAPPRLQRADPQGTGPLTHTAKPERDGTTSRQRMKHPFPSAEQGEGFRGPHGQLAAVC